MNYILPSINSNGIFQLKTPFDTDLTPSVPYTCLSIRTLSDMIGAGIDPEATIYAPKNLSHEIFAQDLVDGVSIIGLQSGSGDWVYVPTSYIASYPNGSGVPYTAVMIGVSLGAIPDALDVSGLQVEIGLLCTSILGVLPATKVVVVSKTQLIDDVVHEQLETIRLNRTTTDASSEMLIGDLQNQLQLANTKIGSLENYIVTQNLIAAESTSRSISTSVSESLSTVVSLSTSISESISTSISQSISISLSTGI